MFVRGFVVAYKPLNSGAKRLQVHDLLIAQAQCARRGWEVGTAGVKPGHRTVPLIMVYPIPLDNGRMKVTQLVWVQQLAKMPKQPRVVVAQQTAASAFAPGGLCCTAQVRCKVIKAPAA